MTKPPYFEFKELSFDELVKYTRNLELSDQGFEVINAASKISPNEQGLISAHDIALATGISFQTVKRRFDKLTEQGFLSRRVIKTGVGRSPVVWSTPTETQIRHAGPLKSVVSKTVPPPTGYQMKGSEAFVVDEIVSGLIFPTAGYGKTSEDVSALIDYWGHMVDVRIAIKDKSKNKSENPLGHRRANRKDLTLYFKMLSHLFDISKHNPEYLEQSRHQIACSQVHDNGPRKHRYRAETDLNSWRRIANTGISFPSGLPVKAKDELEEYTFNQFDLMINYSEIRIKGPDGVQAGIEFDINPMLKDAMRRVAKAGRLYMFPKNALSYGDDEITNLLCRLKVLLGKRSEFIMSTQSFGRYIGDFNKPKQNLLSVIAAFNQYAVSIMIEYKDEKDIVESILPDAFRGDLEVGYEELIFHGLHPPKKVKLEGRVLAILNYPRFHLWGYDFDFTIEIDGEEHVRIERIDNKYHKIANRKLGLLA